MPSNESIFDKFSKHINKTSKPVINLPPREREYSVACEVVRTIFGNINLCLQTDRSRVHVNRFEKEVIKGMLSEKVLSGINGYVNNMYAEDIKNLMNDILGQFPLEMLENEIIRRKQKF